MDEEVDHQRLIWVEELLQAKDKLEASIAYEKSKRWMTRRWLVHPYNQTRSRQDDFFHTTFQELKNYPEKFKLLMRMEPKTFRVLLNLVQKNIKPKHITKTAILAEQDYLSRSCEFLLFTFFFLIFKFNMLTGILPMVVKL